MNKKFLIRIILIIFIYLIFISNYAFCEENIFEKHCKTLKSQFNKYTEDHKLINIIEKEYYNLKIPSKSIIESDINKMFELLKQKKKEEDNAQYKPDKKIVGIPEKKKAEELIAAVYKERIMDKKLLLLKKCISLWESRYEFKYLVNEQTIVNLVKLIYETFITAIDDKNADAADYLFDELIKKKETYLDMIEIQGTGHNLNMAYIYEKYIPYLIKVDYEKALKEANYASKLIDCPGFEAEVLLSAAYSELTLDKPNITKEQIKIILDKAQLANTKEKGKTNKRIYSEYINICRIFLKYIDDKYVLNKKLIEYYMLAKNCIYAPIYPLDVFLSNNKLTSITDILLRMKEINETNTILFIEKSIIPKLGRLRYLYSFEDHFNFAGQYPHTGREIENKIYTYLELSSILYGKRYETAKKIAVQAVNLLPSHLKGQKGIFSDSTSLDCLANLSRFDYDLAIQLTEKYKIPTACVKAHMIKWAPELFYEKSKNEKDIREIKKISLNMEGLVDNSKIIKYFYDYVDANPTKDIIIIENKKYNGIYTGEFLYEYGRMWVNTKEALELCSDIKDPNIRFLTMYGLLKFRIIPD